MSYSRPHERVSRHDTAVVKFGSGSCCVPKANVRRSPERSLLPAVCALRTGNPDACLSRSERYSQEVPMCTNHLKPLARVSLAALLIASGILAFGSDQQKAEKRLRRISAMAVDST